MSEENELGVSVLLTIKTCQLYGKAGTVRASFTNDNNKKCGAGFGRHGMPHQPLMTQIQHFVSRIKKRQR